MIFDVGHGAASFTWRVAVPIVKEGFLPDSISTDLHNSAASTRHEGHAQRDEQVPGPGPVGRRGDPPLHLEPRPRDPARSSSGNLSVGSPADVAVLRLEQGEFGFLDAYGGRLQRQQKLTCEMTLRDGKIVYELNGLSRPTGPRCPRAIAPRAILAGTATAAPTAA